MQKIICFGDSITGGKPFAEGRRWTGVMQTELDKVAPGKFEVFNRGVGGNNTHDALLRYDADVIPLLPGIVLIEFGFNDAAVPPNRAIARVGHAAFRENLGEIIRLVKSGKGKPVLMTNHLIDKKKDLPQGNKRSYYQNFKPYQGIIREVAESHRIPLIDLEAEMEKAKVKPSDLVNEDGLHLTKEGNRIYASFVLKGLHPLLRLK